MPHYDADGALIRVGRKIRLLRERSNMTQAQLAKKLHFKKEIVNRIENGQYNMRLITLIRIAGIFGRRLKITFVKRKGGI